MLFAASHWSRLALAAIFSACGPRDRGELTGGIDASSDAIDAQAPRA